MLSLKTIKTLAFTKSKPHPFQVICYQIFLKREIGPCITWEGAVKWDIPHT